ncbi:MAG: hypothetical protein R2762_02770 [Bryobacteraceae bacterium]
MNYTSHGFTGEGCAGLKSFSRPRYFYGQLLDVRHFESEQDYFKRKIWMLNRMVSGYGVVCGLDVQVGADDHSVIVKPGLALDKCGREIVVHCDSNAVTIEPMPADNDGDKKEQARHCEDEWVHLAICYEECKTSPEPVMAGGCDSSERCSPGAIREGYELRVIPGKAPEISVDCDIPNLIKGNSVNYRALADWVSAPCESESETCITLANIRRGATVELSDIDISARPIVYSLDLLWQLVVALTHETQSRRSGKN